MALQRPREFARRRRLYYHGQVAARAAGDLRLQPFAPRGQDEVHGLTLGQAFETQTTEAAAGLWEQRARYVSRAGRRGGQPGKGVVLGATHGGGSGAGGHCPAGGVHRALAQRDTNVICVYTAIGQRTATVADVTATLWAQGAQAYTVVVVADADSPPGQQYLVPYAACSVAEYFVEQGRHVLIVYDDLTRHADAYRRVGLLLGRPPGREAYPADVFYLHARRLARATRLNDAQGGGSLTALPIANTQAGNIAAYIPTNLISITDGQIYFDSRRFNEGVRPAVDVGLSVSRVGGKAQPAVLRQLAGDSRLVYAQLHELETFPRLGAELEPESHQRLERGQRVREALKQPHLAPLRLGHQVATLFALREGYLDRVAVARVGEFLAALRERLEGLDSDVLASIERDDARSTAGEERLRAALAAVERVFLTAGSNEPGPS